MRKRLFFSAFLIIGIYLIVILGRDLWTILSSRKRVEEAAEKVEKLEREQARLEDELRLVEEDEFIEEEARNKLMLAREKEVVVLLPEQESNISDQEQEGGREELANWEKWLELFR